MLMGEEREIEELHTSEMAALTYMAVTVITASAMAREARNGLSRGYAA